MAVRSTATRVAGCPLFLSGDAWRLGGASVDIRHQWEHPFTAEASRLYATLSGAGTVGSGSRSPQKIKWSAVVLRKKSGWKRAPALVQCIKDHLRLPAAVLFVVADVRDSGIWNLTDLRTALENIALGTGNGIENENSTSNEFNEEQTIHGVVSLSKDHWNNLRSIRRRLFLQVDHEEQLKVFLFSSDEFPELMSFLRLDRAPAAALLFGAHGSQVKYFDVSKGTFSAQLVQEVQPGLRQLLELGVKSVNDNFVGGTRQLEIEPFLSTSSAPPGYSWPLYKAMAHLRRLLLIRAPGIISYSPVTAATTLGKDVSQYPLGADMQSLANRTAIARSLLDQLENLEAPDGTEFRAFCQMCEIQLSTLELLYAGRRAELYSACSDAESSNIQSLTPIAVESKGRPALTITVLTDLARSLHESTSVLLRDYRESLAESSFRQVTSCGIILLFDLPMLQLKDCLELIKNLRLSSRIMRGLSNKNQSLYQVPVMYPSEVTTSGKRVSSSTLNNVELAAIKSKIKAYRKEIPEPKFLPCDIANPRLLRATRNLYYGSHGTLPPEVLESTDNVALPAHAESTKSFRFLARLHRCAAAKCFREHLYLRYNLVIGGKRKDGYSKTAALELLQKTLTHATEAYKLDMLVGTTNWTSLNERLSSPGLRLWRALLGTGQLYSTLPEVRRYSRIIAHASQQLIGFDGKFYAYQPLSIRRPFIRGRFRGGKPRMDQGKKVWKWQHPLWRPPWAPKRRAAASEWGWRF